MEFVIVLLNCFLILLWNLQERIYKKIILIIQNDDSEINNILYYCKKIENNNFEIKNIKDIPVNLEKYNFDKLRRYHYKRFNSKHLKGLIYIKK